MSCLNISYTKSIHVGVHRWNYDSTMYVVIYECCFFRGLVCFISTPIWMTICSLFCPYVTLERLCIESSNICYWETQYKFLVEFHLFQELPGLNLGSKIGCPSWSCPWFCLISRGKCRESSLNWAPILPTNFFAYNKIVTVLRETMVNTVLSAGDRPTNAAGGWICQQ
jgi:hypothetical protein